MGYDRTEISYLVHVVYTYDVKNNSKRVLARVLEYIWLVCILYFRQSSDPAEVASQMEEMHPMLLVLGDLVDLDDLFIIAEKTVICRVSVQRATISLLACYFIFNMEYPVGLNNVYSVLEIVLLRMRPSKVSIVVDRALAQIPYEL